MTSTYNLVHSESFSIRIQKNNNTTTTKQHQRAKQKTTTKAIMATTTTYEEKSRYDRLMKLVDMGFQKSRQGLDTASLVEESYGQDAYGSTELLYGVVNSMLDKVDETAKRELKEFLDQQGIPNRLERVEAIVNKLVQQELAVAQDEKEDAESSQEMLGQALLPPGISLEDVLLYNAYQSQMEQKKTLEETLQSVKEENQALEQEIAATQTTIGDHVQELQKVARTLEKSADGSSMIVS